LAAATQTHPGCVIRPVAGGDYIVYFSGVTRSNIVFDSFKIDNTVNIATQSHVSRITGATCTNCEWRNFTAVNTGSMTNGGSAFTSSSDSAFCDNAVIEGWWISSWEEFGGDGAGTHGIYSHCNNATIRGNRIENVHGLGIQYYSSTGVVFSGGLIENNFVKSVGRRGIYVGNSNTGGAIVQRNIVVDAGNSTENPGITTASDPTGAGISVSSSFKVYNNVVVNNRHSGIYCGSCTNTKNNIALGNASGAGSQITTPGATNLVTGTQTNIFVDPTGYDFNLKEGSVAIDGGTPIAGLTYVGANPDQGAYEACVRNKAVVENDEPTHYHIAYDCPVQSTKNGVTLQTPTVGNWAIVVAGVSKTLGNGGLVSAAISGLSTVEVVLASAVTNGQSLTDAMTRSASPTLTDSFAIGGVYAKVRTYAASSGTNNVGAGVSHAVVQSRYQFFKLRGAANTVVTQCATCAENVPITLPPGAAFRLRIKFRSDDTVGSVYNLRYAKDGGAYTLTPDAFGADFISWHGITADTDIVAAGTATTEILTSDEASDTACAVIRTSSDYPSIALNNSETECEYVLKISTSAPVGTTYDFRVYDGSGAAIDTYTNTPRLTVGPYTMMES